MKRTSKRIAIALLFLTGIVAVTIMFLRGTMPLGQTVTLRDGTQVRFRKVTVGVNHVYDTPVQRAAGYLPDSLENLVLKIAGQTNPPIELRTSETNLVLWVEQTGPGGTPGIPARIILRAPGARFGQEEQYVGFQLPAGQSNQVHTVHFYNWPRRSESLEFVLMQQGENYNYHQIGSFQFENPLRSDAPTWQPDPIGTVRHSGDLKVTLLHFVSGVRDSHVRRTNTATGQTELYYYPARTNGEPRALVKVEFDSPRGASETWQLHDADLSDSMGNTVGADSRSGMTDVMVFGPVLWAGDDAWKLRLHLKRSEGFAESQLITFSNIAIPPLNTTNIVNLTNELQGIQMVFEHLIHRPPRPATGSWSSDDLSEARLIHEDLGETNQIDLVSIIAQPMGSQLTSSGNSWSSSSRAIRPDHIPTNTTHLDFTFALHQTRFVEFNVAPNWTTNGYVITEE